MIRPLALLALLGVLASGATAFLISNTRVGGRFVFEKVPADRRPLQLLVDTEGVPDVANPLAVTQDLMNQWNAVSEAEDVFGSAVPGGAFNGATVGDTFGTFTNTTFEVAWDDTGEILTFFGLGSNVLGITLKSVDAGRGDILDLLVVVNTQPGFLVAPGTGATAEELFRATLLHELGHAAGLGHTPVGIVNPTTFGLALAAPSQIPTMYPFRLPIEPQEGTSINGDDVAALTEVYPEDTSGLGSISGTVRTVSGAPINEIAIRAVGPAGVGEQHYGVLTNADASGQGRFTVPHLPPGGYRVVVEAVNGRGSVTSTSLAGSNDALGADPYVFAVDELWQPGDTWDPAVDVPTDFAFVQVRAGRDTGGIDFVLNGSALLNGDTVNGSLEDGDASLPDAAGGFHFVDYFVFAAAGGEQVTIDADTSGVVPRLRLLRPSDATVIAADLPLTGSSASLDLALPEAGVYTVAISARATTGNPGGTGLYTLALSGAGDPLPATPVVTGAMLARGPGDPGAQQFASPVCSLPLLQLALSAPSHEELWVDAVRVRAGGTGDDARDVARVSLVHDVNGDGLARGEPVLATGTFAADDGTLLLGGLDIELDPGATMDLLVVYDVTVESVSSAPAAAGLPLAGALAPLLLLAALRRRRVLLLALLLGLAPLSCGGGGGSGCNGPFDPDGAVVTFQATVDAGGVTAFAPTTDPGSPLPLPAAPLASGTLSVSN